jgi:hypothetical protein
VLAHGSVLQINRHWQEKNPPPLKVVQELSLLNQTMIIPRPDLSISTRLEVPLKACNVPHLGWLMEIVGVSWMGNATSTNPLNIQLHPQQSWNYAICQLATLLR